VTGLVMHWPCITDVVVYPPMGSTTYGLKAHVRKMSSPPKFTVYLSHIISVLNNESQMHCSNNDSVT